MNNLKKILLNKSALRVFSRQLTLKQLEIAIKKLTVVAAERADEEENKRKKLAEQKEILSTIATQIYREGIDVEALIQALSGQPEPRIRRKPRPAKYRYTNEDGTEKTWTGQGRTPSSIQSQINAGKTLSDFLID